MSFLTAEWRKLLIANYEVSPETLKPYLPYGTVLDTWQGQCYASLIGFMFVNTKLLGMKIPFHVNFEEVNLRFYVKRKAAGEWRRGVVFIKEIVPKPAITFVANTIYKEHYQTMKMAHSWKEEDGQLAVKYQWKNKGQWHAIEAVADPTPEPIVVGTKTEFITEHYWGYAKAAQNKTNEYEVAHPRWLAYPVKNYHINVDFAAVYGADFAHLSDAAPTTVMLAEGSEISVENKQRLL